MNISDFIPDYEKKISRESKGTVAWQSPSNLAIVKYWGKHGIQLPCNPSISITLSEAVTQTSLKYHLNPQRKEVEIEFLFEGVRNEAFRNRIVSFLSSIEKHFPFLSHCKLEIHSKNSFPHSSGIASSASSMSALALCLCDMEKELFEPTKSNEEFLQKASFISRLGSGSACRSVYPYFGLWGNDENMGSSDLYAVPVTDYHEVFKSLRNDILIVSAEEKSVSSSAGHKLMEGNPYANTRFDQAKNRTVELKSILENGDVDAFGEMLESEALTLHALMMASEPSYLLVEPNTINVINEIRMFRKEKSVPIYFSLDAGPNVHIVSFEKDRNVVSPFLDRLKKYAVEGKILNDRIGLGAKKLK